MKKQKLKGLSSEEIPALRKKYGYNRIKSKKEFTLFRIFFAQFTSFIVILLLISGAVSIILEEYIDGIAIIGIVLINAIIGLIQEYKAENAVKALKKLVEEKAVVFRDGIEMEIDIKELVPGDLVVLSEGDKIPADIKLIEGYSMKVDEAILTGESVPSSKDHHSKEEKDNKLYKGTIIVSGRGYGEVTAIGKKTEFGKIIKLLSTQEETKSPLTMQLDAMGKKLGAFVILFVIIIFGIGIVNDNDIFDMMMTSVALGVSAIPEGLPIIVTLTLAMGVQILAKRQAIVRKMNAIETLGATTVICSDKTGTLTLNEMTVKKVYYNNEEIKIPGEGYEIGEELVDLKGKEGKKLAEICENCNNSYIGESIIGDPTEIALKVLTRKAKLSEEYEKIDEKVFSSERKMMSTLHKISKKEKIIYSKGALEEILKKSNKISIDGKIESLDESTKKEILKKGRKYAEEALRVLGFAYKEYKEDFDEKNLIFVGFVGMIDPPRASVEKSINTAKKAGIKVKIITGDHPLTAQAIGKNIGLDNKKTIIGEEIDKMNDQELKEALQKVDIFARTKPQHKYRLVDILKRENEVVAVTGDGVNDAPALKHSDVGIAMGIKGTEATKEVADIVLKDDNFTTIIKTIEEGRRIYHNILAFIKYMLSSNFDTIIAVGVITIMGFPLPILPLQVLWINLTTDAFPALALGKSKANKNIMKEKPHPKREKLFKKFFFFVLIAALIQSSGNIFLYFYGLGLDEAEFINSSDLSVPSHARTLVFSGIVVFELMFAFVCKEEKFPSPKSFFSNWYLIFAVLFSLGLHLAVVYHPYLQEIFNTVPLTQEDWILLGLFSLTALLVPLIHDTFKAIFNFIFRRKKTS